MDLVYALYRKYNSAHKSLPDVECLHEGASLCCVSSQNIVAFSTQTELEDVSGKTWGSHVYVADLNTPWHSHKVLSQRSSVTTLEWDLSGDKLLVGDTCGNVSLFSTKDHVLNEWTCLGTATFPSEHILGAAFFHNGKKIALVNDKKDSLLYAEKFAHVRFAASVREFGGRAAEGCLVISTTGMVGAVGIAQDGPLPLIQTSDSLGSTRHRITALDICYGKNGHFLVAVSSGDVHTPIQCYRVSVKRTDDKYSIVSQALPSFFLQATPGSPELYRNVTRLKFVVREDADSLVVAASGDVGSLVEVWELREKPIPVHKLFQNKIPPFEPFKTVLWQPLSQYRINSPITAVATGKVSLTTTLPPSSYVIVATADASIHCLTRDYLKPVSSASLTMSTFNQGDVKHIRLTVNISHMDLTWLGGALVVVDTLGQLYLYRLQPSTEPGGLLSVPVASTLLEYCLVTGLDWWDLLMSLRPTMLDPICDRLTESFLTQPPGTQQYHYVAYLSLKMSLYRLSLTGQSKAADLTALLMLHSVSTAFKSLLRPSDLVSHDKGPAESLAAVMGEKLAAESLTDVDKVLLHLEAKEFTVERSTLQSLQQLIQWVADLALNLLASLPEQRKSTGGYELLRDTKAVCSVRELLVIIRIWGLVQSTCLPVFVRSAENLDVLALLYRLLSRLVQTQDPDDSLIDECCLLPSQVMIPELNAATATTALASPALFYQSLPIQLEYGVEPDSLLFEPELSVVEGAMSTEQTVDTIRHIYLGKLPLIVKQCCRCGGKAQLQTSPRTAAIRAWDQRWMRACRCGGHWRVHKCA